MQKTKAGLFISLFFINIIQAQEPAYQNLYFIKKDQQPSFKKEDYTPGKNGFYIYRNCIYDLVLKNKSQIPAKIIDIKNDSIYYTLYVNENVAEKNKKSWTRSVCILLP